MVDRELEQIIAERAAEDGAFAVAYALLKLADAQDRTATQLKWLGTGDAATSMGALEYLAVHLGERLDALAVLAEGVRHLAARRE